MNSRRTVVETLESRQLLAGVPSYLGGAERANLDLSDGWKFIQSDVANAQSSSVSDASWQTISLPHTFNAEDGADGGNDYYRGATWYRNVYTLSKVWAKRRIYINVGAAASHAQVYVNGQLVGTHDGDYAGFTFDITNALSGTTGQKSIIAIRVDNSYDATLPGYTGDFTKFGGLTRGVTLFATNKLHVNSGAIGASGLTVTQYDVSSASATLSFTTNLRNDWTDKRNLTIRQSLVDASGNLVAQTEKLFKMSRKQSKIAYQNFTIQNPHLWNGVADPYLYTLYTQVDDGGSILDTISTKVGVRDIHTDSTGLVLNGQHVELKGVNLHDDKDGLGTAMTDGDRDRDIKLLLNMGANAVRFAHWQVDQDWYDLCDEKGLLVWTEIPLWGQSGVPSGQAFADNAAEALRELIRQNYNHPSIAYWGLYNEIPDNTTTRALITTLNTLAHQEDPIRETIGTTYDDYSKTVNLIPDVTTFNRYYGWYSYNGGRYTDSLDTRLNGVTSYLNGLKSAQPDRSVGFGEYGAGSNINQHTDADPSTIAPTSDPGDSSFQPEEYQSYINEQTWKRYEASNAQFGVFLWEFADSANDDRDEGGLPGLNTKGLLTYDRSVAKDSYYFYKSQWSSDPMLYLTSKRFTNRSDASTSVKVYSNLGANVELLINGVSQGTRNDGDGVLEWDNVTLSGGANTILVRATVGGKTYTDTATWTLGASGSGLRAQSLASTAAATKSPDDESSATKNFFADDDAKAIV